MTAETESLAHQLDQLIEFLAEENSESNARFSDYPRETVEEKFELYRAYVNVRKPQSVSEEFLITEADVLSKLMTTKEFINKMERQPMEMENYLQIVYLIRG